MVDESNKDYVRLARAKGVSENNIALRHIFRNAMVPLGAVYSLRLPEHCGRLHLHREPLQHPGHGGLLVTCVQRHDNTMVQGIVLLYACVGIIGLILGDLLMVLMIPASALARKRWPIMLFRMKDEKAHQLEAELDKLQADGPAAWAKLPEEELFTPAGFSEERAEATSYSNYSYWGSTFRAFLQEPRGRAAARRPHRRGGLCIFAALPARQADPNLCAVDPATGIQYRNIAPVKRASSGVPTPSARTSGPASGPAPAPA